MIVFILNKSRNTANWLFIITPALFVLILLFNMINYYGDIIHNFLLWFPYLIAPLGMLLSALYIVKGPGFQSDRYLQLFVVTYVGIALLLSIYPDPLQYGNLTSTHMGLMHLYLIIPFIGTIYYFQKILPELPEQKAKIYYLILGLIIVTFGSLFRTLEYVVNEQDSTLGMIVIVAGSILTLLAFAGVKRKEKEEALEAYTVQIS